MAYNYSLKQLHQEIAANGSVRNEALMSEPSLVDQWLNRWEKLRENGAALRLDDFIKQHCQDADPELVTRFREQVRALESMNVQATLPRGAEAGEAIPPQRGAPAESRDRAMILLEITKRHLPLSSKQQGLATGANARAALRRIFDLTVAQRWTDSSISLALNEETLQRMIVKYSEQWVFQPLREIQRWFAYENGAYLDPGYPPLYYAKTGGARPSPSKSAVSAIGEGVAGFLAQRLYKCRKVARPNHDYPDVVMEANNSTFLLEAKATTQANALEGIVADELPRIASFASSAIQMDNRPVTALLIATELVSESQYRCLLVEVHLL